MAFWVVSDCHTNNKREEYVRVLQKYIKIDIFGKCTNSRYLCPKSGGNECIKKLSLEYKFYIAFENSDCKEYITEKFYRTLTLPVVPVVMGWGDYAINSPPNSYIDVNDFTSIKALADYLKELDKDQVNTEKLDSSVN
jgi:hypothetical protein